MLSRSPFPRGLPVPSGRLARLARFGGMATAVAGGMLADGARQFARGGRPSLADLLATPDTILKVTEQLAQLRGAAMKIGQMVSMDAGEMLPPELAEILGRLRADAQPMPQGQLRNVLDQNWGRGWESRFAVFNFRPLAAASVGQVHRARTLDGRDLAIKVQYPGVRRSIDSDVDNVALLLRLTGLIPGHLDIGPLLGEAKRQLHEEADYALEAACLTRFGALLDGDPDFHVPTAFPDFSTNSVLAMSFADGVPIEELVQAPQAERDRVATRLIDLGLRELFIFHLMQTDPNLANYRFDGKTGRIVLLDFGATRAFSSEFAERFRRLAAAGISGDRTSARDAMAAIGFFDAQAPRRHQEAIISLFEIATEPLRRDGIFDFGDTRIVRELRERGLQLAQERHAWRIPPIEPLYLQRKFGGMYLLAARLKARVDVRALFARHGITGAE